MSSELSPAQIQQIASAMEDPKLSAQFRALLGIKSEETEEPAPKVASPPSTSTTLVASTATGRNAGKSARPEQPLADVDAHTRTDPESASDIVSLVRDVTLSRRVAHQDNTYVPNGSALFYVLHLMDKLLAKNFRARRAHQLMNPYAHQLYFAILFSVQVARCLKYANLLDDPIDLSFLDTFLDAFPPEKLAIPGPLLPFFKSLTTYRTQNELYARVSPCFPFNAMNGNAAQSLTHVVSGPVFPHVPVAVHLYNEFRTAAAAANPDFHTIHWPFVLDAANADAPQHYTADIAIAGHTFLRNRAWQPTPAHNLNSPASRYRPVLPRDYYTNIHDNIDDWPAAPAPVNQIRGLREWLCMTRTSWFRNFLPSMAAYSSLWLGSGSLADASVDGPAPGAYICRYQANTTAPTNPNKPFDVASHFSLSTRMYTSQGTPEPITEKLAAYSQVHARLSTDHPFNGTLTAAQYRTGNVWDARPLYGPSSEDYTYESIEESLRRFVQPYLLK